jgi:capsid protein
LKAPGFFSDPFIRAAWLGFSWSGDGPGALDPLKEANAAEKRIKIGLTTLPKESLAYDGSDWEANHRTSVRVTAERVEGGLEAPVLLQQPGAAPPQLPAGSVPEPEDDDPGENEDPTELD